MDVPFATAIIGFRPRLLPPIPSHELGVPIGQIHSGHWAERTGLKEGDTITHVNGRSVASMKSGDEFLQSISTRPLTLTIQISITPTELSEVVQSFDWNSRLAQVDSVRKKSEGDPKHTDELFERVFTGGAVSEEKSSLFDFTKWMGSLSAIKEPDVVVSPAPPSPPLIQITPLVPEATSATPKPFTQDSERTDKIAKKVTPITTRTLLKWVASHPLCVRFKIEEGLSLPTRAGTLGLDYYFQPFSAEPFVELSLVASPAREVTMNEILDSKPIEYGAIQQTPICDSKCKWDYSGSLLLTTESFTEGDVMLVGKLMDYRRLEAARPMGVFAIRLDSLEISDDIARVKPSMISLSLIDSYTFDVSKTKIRASVCLKGRQVTYTEAMRMKTPPRSKEASVAPSPKSSPSLLSSPMESSGASTPPEVDAEAPLLRTTMQAAQISYQTPFQRAYQKALSDIKRGDNSPIRNQNYTLR